MSNLVHACHLAKPRGVTRWLNISRLGICAQDYADVQTARLSYMYRNYLVYNELQTYGQNKLRVVDSYYLLCFR